jgi:hypothetical protein
VVGKRSRVANYRWSEAIAVGNLALVANVKDKLGSKAAHREVTKVTGRIHFVLKVVTDTNPLHHVNSQALTSTGDRLYELALITFRLAAEGLLVS